MLKIRAQSTSSDNEDDNSEIRRPSLPPKPKRPMTAYHVYFQLERNYILQKHEDYVPHYPEQIDENASERPERYRTLIMPKDWYISKEVKIKKKDRKNHGIISFVELSKTISHRWNNEADYDTKMYCRDIADDQLERYREEVTAYVEKFGEESLKVSSKPKSKSSVKRKQSQASTSDSAQSDDGSEKKRERILVSVSPGKQGSDDYVNGWVDMGMQQSWFRQESLSSSSYSDASSHSEHTECNSDALFVASTNSNPNSESAAASAFERIGAAATNVDVASSSKVGFPCNAIDDDQAILPFAQLCFETESQFQYHQSREQTQVNPIHFRNHPYLPTNYTMNREDSEYLCNILNDNGHPAEWGEERSRNIN